MQNKDKAMQNYKIEVKENEIRITRISKEPLRIVYIPNTSDKEYSIIHSEKGIEIEKVYPVMTSPDDYDYEFETLYPCQVCERKKDYILKLERKIEYLKNLFEKILD